MASLTGWMGDHPKLIADRQPNEIIVQLSPADKTFSEIYFAYANFYPRWLIEPQAPKAVQGFVIGIRKYLSNTFALKLAMADPKLRFDKPAEPGTLKAWSSGTHLFIVSLRLEGRGQTWLSTFATAEINHKIPTFGEWGLEYPPRNPIDEINRTPPLFYP